MSLSGLIQACTLTDEKYHFARSKQMLRPLPQEHLIQEYEPYLMALTSLKNHYSYAEERFS